MTSDYQPHWDRDLARGKQGEMFVADIADALANQRSETKTDAWWLKSNRLYVETEQCKRGIWEPSGINVCTAPVWCFVAGKHGVMLAIATEHMRRAVVYSVKRFPANGQAAQNRGAYKTKGVFVYWHDIINTRDQALDEH